KTRVSRLRAPPGHGGTSAANLPDPPRGRRHTSQIPRECPVRQSYSPSSGFCLLVRENFPGNHLSSRNIKHKHFPDSIIGPAGLRLPLPQFLLCTCIFLAGMCAFAFLMRRPLRVTSQNFIVRFPDGGIKGGFSPPVSPGPDP